MSGWPDWHLLGEPVSLAKYVLPREVESLVRLPGPSSSAPLEILGQIYSRLSEMQIRYAYEEPAPIGPWQAVRSPRKVLLSPGIGNCLDVSLVFAAANLVAGLRTVVVVIESADSLTRHALLIVDLMPDDSPGPTSGLWDDPPQDVLDNLTSSVEGPPRRYCALDAALCAEGADGTPDGKASFAEAIVSGQRYMTSPDWSWRFGVDLGVLWSGANTFHDSGAAPGSGSRTTKWTRGEWRFEGGQGKVHFQRSARGQRVLDLEQDFFVGRATICARAREYVFEGSRAHTAVARKPLVLVGPPGSGKSCVLSRVVMDLLDERISGLAFHGLDATYVDFVIALAGFVGTDANEGAIHEAISSTPDIRRTLVVDALDEMRTDQDQEESVRLLQQLSGYPQIRVVVATRSVSTDAPGGQPWRVSMLSRLHSGRLADDLIVRVDSPEFFNRSEFVGLVEQTLSRAPLFASGQTAAWMTYQQDAAVRRALARVIVDRAGSNYYVGTATAARLSGERETLDPNNGNFTAEALPSGVDELLDAALQRLPSERRERTFGLLSALVYGRGSGLSQGRWLSFATALGVEDAAMADILALCEGPLAPFLVDRVKDGHRLFRPFHRSLLDLIKSRRDSIEDERRLCSWLIDEWETSGYVPDPYITRFLPSHVLAADLGAAYLNSAPFITYCDPSAVAPLARQTLMTLQDPAAAAYMLALPYLTESTGRNAQTLCLSALRQGLTTLSAELRGWADWGPWTLIGEISRPSKVAVAAYLNHRAGATSLTVIQATNGQGDLVVSCSLDGTVHVWDPFDPSVPELARFVGHRGPVRAVAAISWPGRAEPVVVSAGDDGTARIWDPQNPQGDELARFIGHKGPVRAVAAISWPGRTKPVVVSAGDDGTTRVWDPCSVADGEVARFEDHTDWVGCITSASTEEGALLVTGSGDGTVMLRRISSDGDGGTVTYGDHRGRIRHISRVDWAGHEVALISSSDDGTCALFAVDANNVPTEQVETLAVFDGPSGGINATVAAVRGQDTVFVSACSDGVIHVWNPSTWALADNRDLTQRHTGRIRASAVIKDLPDEILLVTGSNDCTAIVWRLQNGEVHCLSSFSMHQDWVRDIATLPWPGLPNTAIASVSGDATVQIWDPSDPERAFVVYKGHTAPVRSVHVINRIGLAVPHLLTASADGTARLWNPYAQPCEDVLVLPHGDIVRCAVGLPEDSGLTIATVSSNEVSVWRTEPDGSIKRTSLRVSQAEMRALATLQVGSQTLVAAVGNDTLVYLINPDDSLSVAAIGEGHRDWVWGVATTETSDGNHLVTVSADGTLRRWSHGHGRLQETARLNIVATGLSVRIFGDIMIVTTGMGFLIFRETTRAQS